MFYIFFTISGNAQEKQLYSNFTLSDFIQRLLTKRCVSFVGRDDSYLLINGAEGFGSDYEDVGTNSEKEPLTFKNCLSYDEVKLSAFLSVSSFSELLNDGRRHNMGVIETDLSKIEREGVIVGLIGARFHKPHFMEYQDIVICPEQNDAKNSKGGIIRYFSRMISGMWANQSQCESRKLWQQFYEESDLPHDKVQNDKERFTTLPTGEIFDNVVMKKRFSISFDTLLLETQARAQKSHNQAYVHIVGIGLGTWRKSQQQTLIFLETFSQRVQALLPQLNNIAVLHFSYFEVNEWKDLKHNGFIQSETHPRGGIKTFIEKRNPADTLKGTEFENMLLVISYAWDGNALPGNEFWFKNLAGSNDSSTACSTLITEIHNPHINSDWVCGDNLHVATADHGVTHISDFANSYPLEQKLYKKLSLTKFVQRLLDTRCVAFAGGDDSYLLLSDEGGLGIEDYPNIGTAKEKKPLILKNCLSYDEVKLSAFLSISSHTELINDGNRYNGGMMENDFTRIEREGVVVGIIGARFEKPYFMEYQDIMITARQNIKENGYGLNEENTADMNNSDLKRMIGYRKLWQKFYEEKDFLHSQVNKEIPRFYESGLNEIFDNVMMKKRYAITFDTLLLEAQARAEKTNRCTYIHIVGIGLGVWRIAPQQSKIFLETFSQRVRHLLPHLNNIGVLHFSWFHMTEWHDLKHNDFIESPTHTLGGIRVFMKNRNPADKLKDEFENMLLVISYAWDGNALPGNEFWFGSLCGSNDPSTACSTLISELHNPHINTKWVCGDNLHITSSEFGVVHITDYAKQIENRILTNVNL